MFFKSFFYLEFNFEILSFLRYVILFLSVSLYSKLNKPYFKIIYLIILLFIICFDTIFQYYYGFNIFGFEKFSDNRLTSFFDDEPIVGSFIMKLVLPIFVYLILENKKKFLLFALSFLSIISVIFSGERMPFLQLLFGFSIFLIFFYKLNLKNILFFVFISLISILILFSHNNVKERYSAIFTGLSHLYSDLEKTSIITKENSSPLYGGVYDYYLNFQSGILIWKDNIFFGKGYRYYKNNCENFLKDGSNVGCSTHPHNIYIEILSDHGLIGLILFILFIFFILLENLRYFDQKKFYGFLITIIVISFPLVTSQSIFSSYYGSIFFFYFYLNKLLTNKN